MNRDTLSQLIKNPSSLSAPHEAELKQMLKVYPYFQALFVLYAKANPSSESIEKAAVRTLDRNLLRKIIVKNFNPNETDAFGVLLKNTEQVNAFEKLRAEEKEEKRKTERQQTSIDEAPKEETKAVIVSFDDDESAASIVYNNQNEFSSVTETDYTPTLEDKSEPTYHPFATDIFDKDLSTNEIVIDEDIRLQTNTEYHDDLVKPISFSEIQAKVEEEPQYQLLRSHLNSTDNFFEEAISQVESEDLATAQTEVKEAQNIDNFFDLPDFDTVIDESIEDESPVEVNKIKEPHLQFLDSYQPRKEEESLVSPEIYEESKENNEINYFIDSKLESNFFDLNEHTTKTVVAKVENTTDLLDAYFLRKEEEASESKRKNNEVITNEVAHNEAVTDNVLVESKIDLLDTYSLRKEEEASENNRKNNEVITNEVAHNEAVTDNILVESKIDLLDAYFLRKEEEASENNRKNNEVVTNEVAHNEAVTDNVLIESKIDLLDAYYLRKEEEASENNRKNNQVITNEVAHNEANNDNVLLESKIDLLDAYYLRKEEEASESKRKNNEVITNEVAHNEVVTDNVLVESKIDLLDAYYLRKEEEAEVSESPTQVELVENPINETSITATDDNHVDFFSEISTNDMLASETENSLSQNDDIQFFDDFEVATDFDTTNFFDDQHHDQPMLITTKPVYKKATQEYQRSLIDKFIKESPAIQIDKGKLANETIDLAEDSTRENLQIVSEHLAKIYASQGRNQKAIEIYQRLSLKNPDKSSYYDTQIKNLEETI